MGLNWTFSLAPPMAALFTSTSAEVMNLVSSFLHTSATSIFSCRKPVSKAKPGRALVGTVRRPSSLQRLFHGQSGTQPSSTITPAPPAIKIDVGTTDHLVCLYRRRLPRARFGLWALHSLKHAQPVVSSQIPTYSSTSCVLGFAQCRQHSAISLCGAPTRSPRKQVARDAGTAATAAMGVGRARGGHAWESD